MPCNSKQKSGGHANQAPGTDSTNHREAGTGNVLYDAAVVSPPLKRAVQRAVTVHDDEAEPLVVLEQLVQRLQVRSVGNHKGW